MDKGVAMKRKMFIILGGWFCLIIVLIVSNWYSKKIQPQIIEIEIPRVRTVVKTKEVEKIVYKEGKEKIYTPELVTAQRCDDWQLRKLSSSEYEYYRKLVENVDISQYDLYTVTFNGNPNFKGGAISWHDDSRNWQIFGSPKEVEYPSRVSINVSSDSISYATSDCITVGNQRR